MFGLELYILLLFMIAAAFIAVHIKDLLSSVIAVGAAGLALSIIFLMLKAPDLALTQWVVEIICVIILIRATLRRETPSTKNIRGFLTAVMTLLFVGCFLFFGYFAVDELPLFGQPEMRVAEHFISQGLGETGATNLVASVLLDYRAYDTLGEATVLFTAVIGTLVVLREIGRKKKDEVVEQND
jgi:multisubunit Na+/H+ antiporter MnhB subunit